MRILYRIVSSDLLSLLFRLVVGIVFILASVYKIAEPEEFAKSITYYKALPIGLVNIMAVIMPWLELFTGAMLVFGVFTRSSALIVAVMLLIFIAAISQALARGIDISCGCFRPESEEKIGLGLLLRDAVWFLMCLQIMRFDSARFSLARFFRRKAEFAGSSAPKNS